VYKITKKLLEYRDRHKRCEACGEKPTHGLPHHIKPVGSGGSVDDWDNLLDLCFEHHFGWCHDTPGIVGLVRKYPHLSKKVCKMLPKVKATLENYYQGEF
jgi:hypothetical protein